LQIEKAGLKVPTKPANRKRKLDQPRETRVTQVDNCIPELDLPDFNKFVVDNLPNGLSSMIMTSVSGKTLLLVHKSINSIPFRY
jgi:hypothetical protein